MFVGKPYYGTLICIFVVLAFQSDALLAENIYEAQESKLNQVVDSHTNLPKKRSYEDWVLFYKALEAEANGDISESIEYYRQVFELNKNGNSSVLLAVKVAEKLLNYEREKEVIDLTTELLQENPNNPNAYVNYFRIRNQIIKDRGGDKELEDNLYMVLKNAETKFPNHTKIFLHKLHYLESYKSISARDQAVYDIPKNKKISLSDWIELSTQVYQLWKNDGELTESKIEALTYFFNKAIGETESSNKIYHTETMIEFFSKIDQKDKLVEIYQDSLKRNPDQPVVREKLYQLALKNDNEELAKNILDQWVELNPYDGDIHFKLFQIHRKNKDWKQSAHFLKQAVKYGKNTLENYAILISLYNYSEMPSEALLVAKEAVREFPNKLQSHKLYLYTLNKIQDYKEAIEVTKTIIELCNNFSIKLDGYFYFNYGSILEKNNNFNQAEEEFLKAIRLLEKEERKNNTTLSSALNYLGYMWLELGIKTKEAGELIIRSHKLEPNNYAINDSLGWYYFSMKNYDESLKYLLASENLLIKDSKKYGEEATIKLAENSVIFDHIGQAYFHSGDIEKAIEYVEKAKELDPDNVDLFQRINDYQKDLKNKNDSKETKSSSL